MSTRMPDLRQSKSGGGRRPRSTALGLPDESFRTFVLGTLHRPNRPGIAEELSLLAEELQACEEAAAGHEFADMYLRLQLLVAEQAAIDVLRQRLSIRPTLICSWITMLPADRIWTVSAVCPFASDVPSATRTLLTDAGIDIRWESTTKDHAPETGLQLLHQHFVVCLPPQMPLSHLQAIVENLEETYGGATEVLPGACLTVLGSR